MNYKLCIISAGTGSRLSPLTDNLNKSLLPVGFRAAISRIIEKHSNAIEIVIAVGFEAEKVKEYIECAHPDRKVTYVLVDKLTGPGSGPGYSLLCCRPYLNKPFVLTTVDTLVKEKCPLPSENWMGVSSVDASSEFCTLEFESENNMITKLFDKVDDGTNQAFIGLAGIKDYQPFFESLASNNLQVKGEVQVSNGFIGLINKRLIAKKFTWNDIGSIEGYLKANRIFSDINHGFDFTKRGEYLYFENSHVIKYFEDKEIISNRIKRASLLGEVVPKIIFSKKNFYAYKKIDGNVIYDEKDPQITSSLLEWLKKSLWIEKHIASKEFDLFRIACKKFYRDKTILRLENFYNRFEVEDRPGLVNGIEIPRAIDLINLINFDWLSSGIPSNFHGDLQFDNILLTKEKDFKLIDWRQDFSNLLDYGDIYYDLAKLNGGLYVSYKEIKKGQFEYEGDINNSTIGLCQDSFLKESKKVLNSFVTNNNYDIQKIEIITGLIFLNMAAMHEAPFSFYIYNMGRLHLNLWVKKDV